MIKIIHQVTSHACPAPKPLHEHLLRLGRPDAPIFVGCHRRHVHAFPPPTVLIVRRWTVVTAARSPQHHRDGRRCTGRSATAIRCFPGAVLPPSRKGCCWRGNNGGRGWAALARGFGRGGDGAIGGGRSHGHRRARWRRNERHRAIMEAWRSEACRIRKAGSVMLFLKRRFGWNPHKVDQGSA